MARYEYPFTIIHRCGHPGSYKATSDLLLGYKERLRARDCNECRDKKGGREVIEVDGKECVLQPITIGTDPQIVWAVKIRKKFLTSLFGSRKEGDPNPIEWMNKHTDARWWIDHRDSPPAQLAA